jgi:hypothetical protein
MLQPLTCYPRYSHCRLGHAHHDAGSVASSLRCELRKELVLLGEHDALNALKNGN